MAKNENTIVAKEIADRNEAELTALLNSKLEELHGVKFKHALGQLRETHQVRSLKKDIARLKTVLASRQKAGAQA